MIDLLLMMSLNSFLVKGSSKSLKQNKTPSDVILDIHRSIFDHQEHISGTFPEENVKLNLKWQISSPSCIWVVARWLLGYSGWLLWCFYVVARVFWVVVKVLMLLGCG